MNYRDVRLGIAALLQTVDGVTTVQAYEPREVIKSDLPSASVWLSSVSRAGADSPQLELGHNDYDTDWLIRVVDTIDNAEEGQVWAEDLIPALRGVFDAAPLIQPNGAGVVDRSALRQIDVLLDLDQGLVIVEATLETRQSI